MYCRLQVAPSGESYGGNRRPGRKAESNGSLLPGLWRDSLHVTCGLTACTPGSAPGPTLGNEYGKTLPCYLLLTRTSHVHARYQRLRPVPTPHSSRGQSSRPILACTARVYGPYLCVRLVLLPTDRRPHALYDPYSRAVSNSTARTYAHGP